MTNCNACPLKPILNKHSAVPTGACCTLQLLCFLTASCPDPLKFLAEVQVSLQKLEK